MYLSFNFIVKSTKWNVIFSSFPHTTAVCTAFHFPTGFDIQQVGIQTTDINEMPEMFLIIFLHTFPCATIARQVTKLLKSTPPIFEL